MVSPDFTDNPWGKSISYQLCVFLVSSFESPLRLRCFSIKTIASFIPSKNPRCFVTATNVLPAAGVTITVVLNSIVCPLAFFDSSDAASILLITILFFNFLPNRIKYSLALSHSLSVTESLGFFIIKRMSSLGLSLAIASNRSCIDKTPLGLLFLSTRTRLLWGDEISVETTLSLGELSDKLPTKAV